MSLLNCAALSLKAELGCDLANTSLVRAQHPPKRGGIGNVATNRVGAKELRVVEDVEGLKANFQSLCFRQLGGLQ